MLMSYETSFNFLALKRYIFLIRTNAYTILQKSKSDMLSEATFIKINNLYFMVHLKNTNLYILTENTSSLNLKSFAVILQIVRSQSKWSANFSNNPRILILFKMLFGQI